MDEASRWAFFMSLTTFITLVFNKVWEEYVRRQQVKEQREKNASIEKKAEEAVVVAEATRQQLVAKVEENTVLTQEAKDAAQEAVRVANHTHDKIVHIGEKRNELFGILLAKVIDGEETGGATSNPSRSDRPSEGGRKPDT